MTKYISGKGLLTHLGIQPFELFNYVKKEEYKPLDQFGRPIPPPDISAKLNQLKELRQELTNFLRIHWPYVPSSEEETKRLLNTHPAWLFGALEERERSGPRRESLLNRIKKIEDELKRRGDKYSWAAYELPDDKKSAQGVLDLLQNAFFEIEPGIEKDPKKEEPLPQKKETSSNFFTRQGDIWHIGFEGKDTRVKHRSGLQYIALLLERPGNAISCLDLYHAANPAETHPMSKDRATAEGLNTPTRKNTFDRINDSRAQSELWTKYQKLQEDKAENERKGNDPIIQAEIEKEMDALKKEMTQRTFHDPIHGKAQSNILKAIARTTSAMNSANMNELSEFLNDHIKPDGKYGYIYTGPPWVISR